LIQVNADLAELCQGLPIKEAAMIRYILVPATGSDTDQAVFQSALAIARPWAAHIVFLHVQPDAQKVFVAMASTDMGGGAAYGDLFASLEREAAARQTSTERQVREFCAREQIAFVSAPGTAATTAEWLTEIGDEPTWLSEHGRMADLLVIGRSREGEPIAMDVLEAALMATGRPVLLAPSKPLRAVGGTVAIAWKNTREAARAVDTARPFIDAADRVVVLSVQEDGAREDRSCDRLAAAICWRNRNTMVRRFATADRPPPDVLLEAAAAVGADLVVMGGYSHSRVREMVLGGFTRRVLQGCDLPVLMAH
jgi:nucleotide-binding universal stress UspA family protein